MGSKVISIDERRAEQQQEKSLLVKENLSFLDQTEAIFRHFSDILDLLSGLFPGMDNALLDSSAFLMRQCRQSLQEYRERILSRQPDLAGVFGVDGKQVRGSLEYVFLLKKYLCVMENFVLEMQNTPKAVNTDPSSLGEALKQLDQALEEFTDNELNSLQKDQK